MTLQDALNMTPEGFENVCEAARPDYDAFKPINVEIETIEAAIEGFAQFKSSPESINALHEAGSMIL
jgi:hypothetical protein